MGFLVRLLLDERRCLVHLVQGHIRAARHVDQHAPRAVDRDVFEERARDRLLRRLDGPPVARGHADAHDGQPFFAHDRLDVLEVHVHVAVRYDQVRYAPHRVEEHLVGLHKSVFDGHVLAAHGKKPLIGNGDERIDLAFQLLQAVVRLEIPHLSFKGEGFRHHGNGEGAHLFRYLGDHGGSARAGAAAEAAGDEDHVGPFERFGDLFRVFEGRLSPDLGVCPRAEPPRQLCAYLDLDGRLVRVEGLDVGIHRDEFYALKARLRPCC